MTGRDRDSASCPPPRWRSARLREPSRAEPGRAATGSDPLPEAREAGGRPRRPPRRRKLPARASAAPFSRLVGRFGVTPGIRQQLAPGGPRFPPGRTGVGRWRRLLNLLTDLLQRRIEASRSDQIQRASPLPRQQLFSPNLPAPPLIPLGDADHVVVDDLKRRVFGVDHMQAIFGGYMRRLFALAAGLAVVLTSLPRRRKVDDPQPRQRHGHRRDRGHEGAGRVCTWSGRPFGGGGGSVRPTSPRGASGISPISSNTSMFKATDTLERAVRLSRTVAANGGSDKTPSPLRLHRLFPTRRLGPARIDDGDGSVADGRGSCLVP